MSNVTSKIQMVRASFSVSRRFGRGSCCRIALSLLFNGFTWDSFLICFLHVQATHLGLVGKIVHILWNAEIAILSMFSLCKWCTLRDFVDISFETSRLSRVASRKCFLLSQLCAIDSQTRHLERFEESHNRKLYPMSKIESCCRLCWRPWKTFLTYRSHFDYSGIAWNLAFSRITSCFTESFR